MPVLCRKYKLFPEAADWRGKILLLETSEERMPPEKYKKALLSLKEIGVFRELNGVLCGKPIDNLYDAEYKALLREVIDDPTLPVVCNLNVGHALPRCIIPFGVPACVNVTEQRISFQES